jgi:hypothetical protein
MLRPKISRRSLSPVCQIQYRRGSRPGRRHSGVLRHPPCRLQNAAPFHAAAELLRLLLHVAALGRR